MELINYYKGLSHHSFEIKFKIENRYKYYDVRFEVSGLNYYLSDVGIANNSKRDYKYENINNIYRHLSNEEKEIKRKNFIIDNIPIEVLKFALDNLKSKINFDEWFLK